MIGSNDMMQAMTKKDVAKALGISTKTVERKVKDKLLPGPSYGLGKRCPRWNAKDIAAIIKAMSNQSESRSASR